MAFLGWWDGELRPDAWWDAELQPAGWFDTELIDTSATAGAQTLAPGLLANSPSFFTATLAPGAVTLAPARVDGAPAFYGPTVSGAGVNLLPARYDNAPSFYAATLAPGPVALGPAKGVVERACQKMRAPSLVWLRLLLPPPIRGGKYALRDRHQGTTSSEAGGSLANLRDQGCPCSARLPRHRRSQQPERF